MKRMQKLIKKVEIKISKTPTEELRNLLRDVNIMLYQQQLNFMTIQKQKKQLNFLIEKFQTPKGNHIIKLLMAFEKKIINKKSIL